MYSKGIRSAGSLPVKYAVRSYATRRVVRGTSVQLAAPTRSFQTTGQTQGQAALSEAPSYDETYEQNIVEKVSSISNPSPSPSSVSQTTVSQPLFLGAPNLEDQATSLTTPAYYRGKLFEREPYWQKIPRWKDVSETQFLSHRWQVAKNIQGPTSLMKFLNEVLPEDIPANEQYQNIRTREAFIEDVFLGIKEAPMSIRLTPHILSAVNWSNPLSDPLRRQFIPMKSTFVPDHPKLGLDSLHEAADSPVPSLVHRYPDKVLFLATSVCGQYCRYCTRSYAVGGNTDTVTKTSYKPIKAIWDEALRYISNNPVIQDVVVSGGDSYYLQPEQLRYIGDRLLAIPHIRRFRIATKGICISPSRTLDPEDTWTDEIIRLSNRGRAVGKQVALHTHFCHPQEFTWVSREAAHKLFQNGVIVRNQTVLLRGVNDNVQTMSALIRELADDNIQPYYVYQCDMVKGIEDLRTPLQTILDLECQIRGSIGGFMMPSFVVDLPGGGGKRLAASYQSYDRKTGISKFVAPAVKGTMKGREKENMIYNYYDPLAFCEHRR